MSLFIMEAYATKSLRYNILDDVSMSDVDMQWVYTLALIMFIHVIISLTM